MRIVKAIVFMAILTASGLGQAQVYDTDILFGKTRTEMRELIPQLNDSFEVIGFRGFKKISLYFNGKGKFDQVEIYFKKVIPEKEALGMILAVFPLNLKKAKKIRAPAVTRYESISKRTKEMSLFLLNWRKKGRKIEHAIICSTLGYND